MARDIPLGMEFVNWQNVPSISESFTKMASGEFNPLGYSVAYGLNKAFGGENEYIANLKKQQEQAFKSNYAGPAQPTATPSAVPAAPAVPSVQAAPSPAPAQSILPTYDEIRGRIQKIIGVQ